MAQNAAQDEDMSMDEILASIRRYVTGDGESVSVPSSPVQAATVQYKAPRVVQLTADDEWSPEAKEETALPDSNVLISDETRASAQKSFQKMEQLRDLKNTTRASAGGRTMDDFMIELLRPMLKQWVDKHLPTLVERIVEREIQNTLHSDRI